MTYQSASRGIMYSAPPAGEQDEEKTRPETAAQDAAPETAEVEPTPQTTDANWTGTLPADD